MRLGPASFEGELAQYTNSIAGLCTNRWGQCVKPASAASVAGLLKYGADGAEQVVCVLTGRGLKDPETAIARRDGFA